MISANAIERSVDDQGPKSRLTEENARCGDRGRCQCKAGHWEPESVQRVDGIAWIRRNTV